MGMFDPKKRKIITAVITVILVLAIKARLTIELNNIFFNNRNMIKYK